MDSAIGALPASVALLAAACSAVRVAVVATTVAAPLLLSSVLPLSIAEAAGEAGPTPVPGLAAG
jgi:hypothetical protein